MKRAQANSRNAKIVAVEEKIMAVVGKRLAVA